MAIVTFAEALEIVRTHAALANVSANEELPLLDALGRVLAQPVYADRDQPPFDRSTRDGYAVRAAEWDGRWLRVVGQVRAGQMWTDEELRRDSALEIMTGAPVAPGFDAVVMVEHVETSGTTVRAASDRRLRPGENIVRRGLEAQSGSTVVRAGSVITPAEIAIAATCGRSTLTVHRRPTVAIAATGDELVELEEIPEPHQIRNSNTYAVSGLVMNAGGRAIRLPIARDSHQALRDCILEGLANDLLVLSGGVSAGKYDLVEEVLIELGAELLFTGVRMQPGKPVVFGRVPDEAGSGWRYFFGLPGNPVSTQVTFHCFVQPFLRVLSGAAWIGPSFVFATMMDSVAANPGLTRILPAHISSSIEATTLRLVPWQGSGDVAANARANCYAVLQEGAVLEPGHKATVLLR